MEQIYFLVKSMDTWTSGDPHLFLTHYFCTNHGFMSAFIVALGVAVLGAALFYGWIGNAADRLATIPVWLITTIVVGVVTLGLTQCIIIGSNTSQTGVFNDIVNYKQELQQSISDDKLNQFNQDVQNLITNIDSVSNEVVLSLNIENAVIAMLLFFIISICVKNLPPYTKSIPF